MDTLYVFGAKYLFIASPLIGLLFFLRQPLDVKKKMILFSAVTIPVIYLLAFGAGSLYDNPRPFVVEGIIPLVQHEANNGFPSGHTLFTAAIAAVVYFFNRRIGNILLLISIVVGMSRVAAHVHHSIDILASVIIAFGVAYISCIALRSRKLI